LGRRDEWAGRKGKTGHALEKERKKGGKREVGRGGKLGQAGPRERGGREGGRGFDFFYFFQILFKQIFKPF
jgi:hypothetical protein